MADTVPLTNNWSGGRVSDIPPDRLKPNQAYVLQNFVLDRLNAPIAVRGAWAYAYTANASFVTFSASSTKVTAVGWMPFSDGVRFVAVDQAGRILQVNGSGVGSSLDSTGLAESGNIPFWHKDRMILPGSSGTKFPWQITSNGAGVSTAAAFSGTFPKATHGASWQTSYLLLSNGGDPFNAFAKNPRRTWISDPGALTFTSTSQFDWPDEILRTVPVTAGIMGFGYRRVWLCTGTIPPGTTSSDMKVYELYEIGTSDPKSVTKYKDYCVWANAEGVYMSDTTSLVDVTAICGLSESWRTDMQTFGTNWTLAAGMYGNYYVVTACNNGTEVFTYVFDLVQKVGFNFIGIPSLMYASVEQPGAPMSTVSARDLLFASSAVAQVGRLQPCFATGTASGKDANGTVIPFQLVTGLYMLGTPAEKRLRRLFLSVLTDVTSPHTDVPEIAYTITNTPLTGLMGAGVNALTWPDTGAGRFPVMVGDRGRWISFRIRNAQAGTAGTHGLAIFSLELEGHATEKSKSGA
jgi:hypothetical protein